jgi:hypothetical protein
MKHFVGRTFGLSHSPIVEPDFVAAVNRSALRQEPFDHIYMEGVFDAASYAALLDAMPDRQFYHELVHHDAMRADGSSTRLRLYLYPELLWRLPAEQRRVWLPVARALCSKALQDAFKHKFRAALEHRFGKPVERIGLYPVPILLRDQPGYRIGIHSDAEHKAITVQFYLPRDASQYLPRGRHRRGGRANDANVVHAGNGLRLPGGVDAELAQRCPNDGARR